jgi:hypothetical protein
VIDGRVWWGVGGGEVFGIQRLCAQSLAQAIADLVFRTLFWKDDRII